MAVAAVLCCLTGCRQEDTTVQAEFRRVHTELTQGEHFEKAWYLLRQLEEFDPEQTIAQVTYHLNRWLAEQGSAADWLRDPMLGDAKLGYLRQLSSLGRLDSRDISTHDVRYLREARWLNDLAKWVQESPPPAELADWLATLPGSLGPEQAGKLASAARLFDWTTRNIQLDPFPVVEGAEHIERPAAEPIPGPGYTLYPWQSLMLGHGDAWLRTRVFVLLLRQLNIDAVVLATAASETAPTKPWTVGVSIGEELYLFEPELGWPILGPDGVGVATLTQVLDAPALLRQLDIGDALPYRIQEADLAHIVALIDASSESLSQKMRIIESRLAGDQRMVLTTSPTALKQRVEQCRGVRSVHLWAVPFEAELFHLSFAELRKRDSRVESQYQWEMAIFSGLSPLVQARQLHFRRQFDRQEERPGAIVRYMEVRIPEREIDQLSTDVDRQALYNLRKTPAETQEAWQMRITQGQQLLRSGKQHASFWLGLVHYEQGEFETASNWFAKRTLEESPDSPWVPGARYNLGRCYEAQGKFAEARATYLLDDSVQRHGNLLRSRWIRVHKLNDTSPEDETKAAGAAQSGS